MTTICAICNETLKSTRALATHLQHRHKIKSKDYTIKYIHNSTQPMCVECGSETRYVSFMFKKYCKSHANLAAAEAGRIGGKIKTTWNKGHTKETLTKLRECSRKYTGTGNPFHGKTHTSTAIDKMTANSRIDKETLLTRLKERENDWHFDYTNIDYESRQKQYISCKCRKCNSICERTLQTLERGSLCHECYPINKYSKPERDLRKIIAETGIENFQSNTRSIITPQELDIHLPEHKFAIEYNGLYWHSEEREGKTYHFDKTNSCREQDIQLFHIFSDEWREKQEIIESMIRQRIGKSNERIFARKCVARIVPRTDSKTFFNKTHISGNTPSKITFGLYHHDTLVMALSLRTSFHRKYREAKMIEIARLSSELDTIVVGGLSKLLKQAKKWARQEKYNGILTYADRRFGEGKGYLKTGFTLIGETKADYWYTDGRTRFNRFTYRAQPNKPEKEVAKEAGVFKIYGCGSNIYEMLLS